MPFELMEVLKLREEMVVAQPKRKESDNLLTLLLSLELLLQMHRTGRLKTKRKTQKKPRM